MKLLDKFFSQKKLGRWLGQQKGGKIMQKRIIPHIALNSCPSIKHPKYLHNLAHIAVVNAINYEDHFYAYSQFTSCLKLEQINTIADAFYR